VSVFDCAGVREVAPEFALGVLDAEERSDVVLHLDHCAPCRTYVAELSEAGDAISLLAPESEPPLGFERRAVERMVGAERRQRWRTMKLVAAVAAAAAILSIVLVRIVDDNRAPTASVAAPTHQTVAMVGADGAHVGEADVQGAGNARSVALTVNYYTLPNGSYRIVLDSQKGTEPLGDMQVVSGKGAWAGTVPGTDEESKLSLVDATGHALCSAELPVS
jgi:hypothetical protein